MYAVRKRTNHVYPDVSPSVLHHPRQETVFLIINTSTISIYCWLNHKYTTFIYFIFFHYRRVCEAIAQEDAESKGKNMRNTVLNILISALIVPFYVIVKCDFVFIYS